MAFILIEKSKTKYFRILHTAHVPNNSFCIYVPIMISVSSIQPLVLGYLLHNLLKRTSTNILLFLKKYLYYWLNTDTIWTTWKFQYFTLTGLFLSHTAFSGWKCVCLTVLEISVFSMVSKEITRYLVDYISTLPWKNNMIIQSFHHCTCLEQKSAIRHYRDLGKWRFIFRWMFKLA